MHCAVDHRDAPCPGPYGTCTCGAGVAEELKNLSIKDGLNKMVEEMKKSKNIKLVHEFANYCLKNPEMRFWQALRNWAGVAYVMAGDLTDPEHKVNTLKDTFYWNGKNE